MSLMPGQLEETPPEGVIGYAVVLPGMDPAMYPRSKKPDAERYAARMHSVAWPLVVARRREDESQPERKKP